MHKLKQASFIFAAAVTWLFLWYVPGTAGAAASAVRVMVQSSGEVQGDQIRFKDIAVIEADELIRQMLENITISRSPKPGKIRIIRKNQLLSSLRSHGDLLALSGLDIPDQIYVKRISQGIYPDEIRERTLQWLGDQFRGKEVAIVSMNLPDSDAYPVGGLELFPGSGQRVDNAGRFTLNLDVLVDGARQGRLRITGQAEVYETMACASRDLVRGTRVTREDAVMEKRSIFDIRGTGIMDISRLEGMVTKSDVRKGAPLQESDLAALPLIKKGEVVTLVAKKNNLEIITSGLCREDGFLGSMVRVENMGSGKVIRGIVRKAAMVEVVY